jgi:membrane protein YqaA with SNARE-associated domain
MTLLGLFLSAFLSATLLPGSSEAALAATLAAGLSEPWVLVAVATLGNTLGALANWIAGVLAARGGRLLGLSDERGRLARAKALYGRFGAWSLLFSWVPIVGDPLTLLAGLAGLRLLIFLPLVGLGKFARYAFILWAVQAI